METKLDQINVLMDYHTLSLVKGFELITQSGLDDVEQFEKIKRLIITYKQKAQGRITDHEKKGKPIFVNGGAVGDV